MDWGYHGSNNPIQTSHNRQQDEKEESNYVIYFEHRLNSSSMNLEIIEFNTNGYIVLGYLKINLGHYAPVQLIDGIVKTLQQLLVYIRQQFSHVYAPSLYVFLMDFLSSFLLSGALLFKEKPTIKNFQGLLFSSCFNKTFYHLFTLLLMYINEKQTK